MNIITARLDRTDDGVWVAYVENGDEGASANNIRCAKAITEACKKLCGDDLSEHYLQIYVQEDLFQAFEAETRREQ